MGWKNESLFKRSWSYDQDGRSALIKKKLFGGILDETVSMGPSLRMECERSGNGMLV